MPNYVAKVGWPGGVEYASGVPYPVVVAGPAYATEAETIAAIIAETGKNYNDAGGRPLPVVSNFDYLSSLGYVGAQYDVIQAGYPMLPVLDGSPGYTTDGSFLTKHAGITEVAAAGLPVQVQVGGFFVTGQLCGYDPAGGSAFDYAVYSEADTAECVLTRNVTGAVAVGTTSITITTDFTHFYRNNRPVRFENLPGDWAALNGNTYTVSSSNGTTFSIAVDASTWGTYTSGGTCTGRAYQMSPWGASTPWTALGTANATEPRPAWLEDQYPNPPRVLYWSNDEFQGASGNDAAADWNRVQLDPRYRTLYTDYASHSDVTKMANLSARCITQYGNFNTALRAGFTESAWQAIEHVGYNKCPTLRIKDCANWQQWQYGGVMGSDFDDLHWTYKAYDGASPEVYDNDWQYDKTAYSMVWSMQNEAMALRFVRDIAESYNSDYWFEAIVWNGYLKTQNRPKYTATYVALGIDYTPDYYKGWSQYCLWILQPRQWRCFVEDISGSEGAYWEVIRDQVAHVHSSPMLRRFWREGVIVENPATILGGSANGNTGITHPYCAATSGTGWNYTSTWNGYPKQYHLATNLDPVWDDVLGSCPVVSADSDKHRPVWTLAYVIGTTPNREWLVYAHSTGVSGATLTNVQVTIPNYQTITLHTVPVDGAFYYVQE